jgi:hypothetical protein
MNLFVCVRKEGGNGKGTDSESLSDTFRYINLTGLFTGLVALRGPMDLFACVNEEGGDGEVAGSQALSDALKNINLVIFCFFFLFSFFLFFFSSFCQVLLNKSTH